MITLTSRQKEIIEYLIEKGRFVRSSELANYYFVSTRTIRKDLDVIEVFLKENGIVLIRKQGTGICIRSLSDDLKQIEPLLKERENQVLSKNERKTVTASMLLIYPNITFQELADICCVSKQTIINDCSEVESMLCEKHIEIVRVHGVGLHIVGEELAIRRLFMELILCNDHSKVIIEICRKNQIMQKQIEQCDEILMDLEKHLHYKFLHKQRVALVLAFMLNRINQGNLLNETSAALMFNEDIEKIATILKAYILNDFEIEYISSILASERVEGRLSDGDEIFHEAYEISEHLISALQKIHDFDRESLQDTIHGLHLHMKAAIYRCRNDIHIRNELIEQVYYTIPVVYEFTKRQLQLIEADYDLTFDENEISYIALYLASIFETGIQESLRVRIMIICAFGLATSSILKARMYQIFGDCDIIGPYSIEEAKAYLLENSVDLVLSTNDFPIDGVSVIYIHPLLKQSDIELIRTTLFQKSFAKMCSLFFSKRRDIKREVHYLREYVTSEDIHICREKDIVWEDAIRKAAEPLLKRGYIEESYIQAMINAVNDFGTYMVFTPKVAYIHARKEDGVHRNCVSLLLLENEISFGSFNTKQVRMIVVFGIQDTEQNLMMNIANILNKSENIEKLSTSYGVDTTLDLHD